MKTTIKVHAVIKCPRVPNFVQMDNGTWLPLIALNDEGLVELSKAWLESLRLRHKEQSKDPEFFHKNAAKGES